MPADWPSDGVPAMDAGWDRNLHAGTHSWDQRRPPGPPTRGTTATSPVHARAVRTPSRAALPHSNVLHCGSRVTPPAFL
jgi:hypothetical protein